MEHDEHPMIQAVKKYLDKNSLTYQVTTVPPPSSSSSSTTSNTNNQNILISLTLNGHNSSYRTYIDLKPTHDRCSVYVETPVKIPPDQRARVTEYCMRVNYTLALGAFEVDFRDGEVRYRYAVDVEESALSFEMIRTQIMVPAATVDKFFPGLMAVTFANANVEEAVNECRGGVPPTTTTTTTSSSSSSGGGVEGALSSQ
mmetsp:Transcript_18793/g.51463  ORF Transcript_18793/g.51463 Transcript_18793/m.51463 type:complete len:200 (-) Transcript_18793:264-863(-)